MSALAMVTQELESPMIDLGKEVGLMAEATLTMCHCIETCQPQPVVAAGRTASTPPAFSLLLQIGMSRRNQIGYHEAVPRLQDWWQPWVWTATWTGGLLSQKHLKAPVDGRWKALLFVNATPRLHIVKPAKGVQSPRSPIHAIPASPAC